MDREMFEKGLKNRRVVLGSQYVDQAMNTADDFNRPMQELVTQYCWGETWGRPGLDRKTRSMLNLAMISALNRPLKWRTRQDSRARWPSTTEFRRTRSARCCCR